MAKPDINDGHIDIANDLSEALMRINLSGYQYRIIWCVFRKTYGWHKSTDKISLTQFEKMTGLKSKYICRAIKELEDRNMIIVDRNNRVNTYKFNSDYDTWKFKTTPKIENSQNREKGLPKERVKPVSNQGVTKEKKETIQKKDIMEIFDYWNKKEIITHRKLGQATASKINAKLKDYSIDEIKDAIHTYSVILKEDDYWWTHTWTLKEFMQRGFEKFKDKDIAYENYLRKDKLKTKKQVLKNYRTGTTYKSYKRA